MEDVFVMIAVICAPCTILFNALVLYIAFKFIELRVKLNQMFVISMTAADMMYGISFMATRPLVESIPHWMCRPYYVINWMCQIASIMFLLFLNVDKFISLSFPLRYNALVTERRVVSQVLICWLIISVYACGSAFEPLLIFAKPECSGCHMSINPNNYAFMIFICYLCPTVISLVISIYIFVLAQHKTRWVPDFPDSKVERRRERRRLFKRIFFVFSSTIWTAVTSLPYRLGSCTVWLCFQLLKGKEQKLGDDHHLNSSWPMLQSDPNFTSEYFENVTNVFSGSDFSYNFTWTVQYSNYSNQTNATTDGQSCMTETTELLIWAFMCLLPFGSVGNPLITIITQRAYRQRALFLWSLFLKRIHAPNFFIPTSYISVRRKSKSEDESTKVVELMSTDDLTLAAPSAKRFSNQNVFELM